MHPAAQPRTKSDIQALLARAGITLTAQRLEIAWVILNRPQHLSAEQILNLVNRTGSTVSKATVYNTLGLFARKGIIREVLVDPNRVFFDSNTDEHHHLYNEDTGILTDIYTNCLQANALPTLPENSTLVGIDVIIRIRTK